MRKACLIMAMLFSVDGYGQSPVKMFTSKTLGDDRSGLRYSVKLKIHGIFYSQLQRMVEPFPTKITLSKNKDNVHPHTKNQSKDLFPA